ncbi:hypothetical protein U6G28_10070 [Actinomycetaceae bacterium MB13-C1-2]|nr:hypothetical protein U6G28_10070 [Actinomycetaceae bacterium MB13-C1-2]
MAAKATTAGLDRTDLEVLQGALTTATLEGVLPMAVGDPVRVHTQGIRLGVVRDGLVMIAGTIHATETGIPVVVGGMTEILTPAMVVAEMTVSRIRGTVGVTIADRSHEMVGGTSVAHSLLAVGGMTEILTPAMVVAEMTVSRIRGTVGVMIADLARGTGASRSRGMIVDLVVTTEVGVVNHAMGDATLRSATTNHTPANTNLRIRTSRLFPLA